MKFNSDLQKINADAFAYYQAKRPLFKQITEPLLELGIKDFGFWRMYKDGSYIAFMNDEKFIHDYLFSITEQGEYFSNKVSDPVVGKLIHLLDIPIEQIDFSKNEILKLMWNSGLWNTLIVVHQKNADYVDCYDFFMDHDFKDASDFFFGNIRLFDNFINYFDHQIIKIIDFDDKSIRAWFKNEFHFSLLSHNTQKSDQIEKFLMHIKFERTALVKDGEYIPLTYREKECLFFIAQYKTVKEIARELGISPRTVETHIQSMKAKAGCHTKSSLLGLLET